MAEDSQLLWDEQMSHITTELLQFEIFFVFVGLENDRMGTYTAAQSGCTHFSGLHKCDFHL